MKVKYDDLYTVAPGVTMICGDKMGVFLGKELTTGEYEMLSGAKYDIAELLEETEEDEVTIVNSKVDIDTLIDVALADIMILANEGWTLEKENKLFDVGMYTDRLKVLMTAKEIVHGLESK